MTAFFPISIRPFSTKVDLVNTVMADHVNALQDEVKSIETVLSTGILSPDYSGSFSSSLISPTTLNARLKNIEAGLVSGVSTAPYVRTDGGSTITVNTTTKDGVDLHSSGTSADTFYLLKTTQQASPYNLRFNINYDGYPYVGANKVLWVNSTEYNSLVALITSAQTAASDANNASNFHPFLTAGM